MRSALYALTALVVVSAWSSETLAQQSGVFDDPFFTYYSYFLPRQAALAAQPRVEDTINQNFANNQVNARTNRGSLNDPSGGYSAFDSYDPDNAYQNTPKRGRGVGGPSSRLAQRSTPTSSFGGHGPATYYSRAAQFYPSLRTGKGPNRNLAVPGRGVRGGGGGAGAAMGLGAGPR